MMKVTNIVPNTFFLFDYTNHECWFSTKGKWEPSGAATIKTWKTYEEAEAFLLDWIKKHPEEYAASVANTLIGSQDE